MEDLANQDPMTLLTADQAIAVVRAQMGRKLPATRQLDAETVLADLGISSLMMTEVFFTIEEIVGRDLDPAAASGAKTIGELVDVVNQLAAADAE